MKKSLLLATLSLGLLYTSCKKDDVDPQQQIDAQLEQVLADASGGVGLAHFVLPLSNEFSKIPQDPKNPLTREKVDLGALLFHESGLGLEPKHGEGTGTYSCASCHFASAGFQAGRHQAIAEGGMGFGLNGEGRVRNPAYDVSELDVQPVRSPSAINIAYQEAILWNGQFGAIGVNAGTEANWTPDTPVETNELGYHGTETQAVAAIKVHRMKMDEMVCQDLNYDALFNAAFPNVPTPQRYDRERAGLAIAAYERTLLANQAPFQLWLRGQTSAMTEQQKRGALLFFGKAKCNDCHDGPSLANMEFHALGMKDLNDCPEETFGVNADTEANLGRFSFTKNDADKYKFKVPQLYNLADSPFYGHGSSFRTVRDVIAYKNKAKKENTNVPEDRLAESFKPLGLSEKEIDDIAVFIEEALRDPNLMRYQPLSVRSGSCIPNNDDQSRTDLGCN